MGWWLMQSQAAETRRGGSSHRSAANRRGQSHSSDSAPRHAGVSWPAETPSDVASIAASSTSADARTACICVEMLLL